MLANAPSHKERPGIRQSRSHAHLRNWLEPRPDKGCDSTRDVGIREPLTRSHPHDVQTRAAGTGGA